jgi:hypothetical protein
MWLVSLSFDLRFLITAFVSSRRIQEKIKSDIGFTHTNIGKGKVLVFYPEPEARDKIY